MVVSINAARANGANDKEGTKSPAKAETVTGIGAYKSQSDFQRVADEIKKGVPNYATLLWSASVAALIHYDRHGNSLVFKPLWEAAKMFSLGEGRKWFNWLEVHSKLTYNPNKLRGEALSSADFNTLFKRDKSKVSNIDGAKVHHWRDHKMTRATSISKPVSLSKTVDTMIARLQKLLESNVLVVTTGTGKAEKIARKATAADVRSELKHKLETIVTQLKSIDTTTRRSPATATPKRTAVQGTSQGDAQEGRLAFTGRQRKGKAAF